MDLEHEIQQLQIQFNNIIVQTQQIKDAQRLMQDNYNNLFNNINSTLQTISSRLSSMTPTTELDKKITAIERRLNVFSDDTSQELLNTTKTHRSDVDKINTRIDNMKSEVVSSLNNEVYKKSEVFNINETYNKNQIDTLVTNQINKTKQEIKNYTTQGYSKNETYTRSEIDNAISDAEDLLTNKFDAMYYTKSDLYNKTELNTKFDGKANINHGIHVPTLLNDNTKFLCSDNTWQSITANNIDAYTKIEANTKFVDKTDFTNELNTKANINHGIHVPTLENDNNKYLRSDNTWQTITANMVNGYTKSEADAKYALKSDTYTQADVDTKLNEKANVNHGIHVPTLENDNSKFLRSDNTWQTIAVNNVDAYTKLESDTKYALKSDIIDKTTLYTKSDVYSKSESDAKYALQSDVYSKTQSDARYASFTDLGNLYVKKIGDTLSGTLSFDKTVEKLLKGMFDDTYEYGIIIDKYNKILNIYNNSININASIRVNGYNGHADLIDGLGNTHFTGQVRADKGFTIYNDDAEIKFLYPVSSKLSLINKDYGLLINGNGIKTKKMIITNPNNSDDNTNTMSVNTDGQIEINNSNGVKSQKFIGNLQGNADSATMINNTKLVFSNGTEMWIG